MGFDLDAGAKVKAGTNCCHPINHCMLPVQNHLEMVVNMMTTWLEVVVKPCLELKQ